MNNDIGILLNIWLEWYEGVSKYEKVFVGFKCIENCSLKIIGSNLIVKSRKSTFFELLKVNYKFRKCYWNSI